MARILSRDGAGGCGPCPDRTDEGDEGPVATTVEPETTREPAEPEPEFCRFTFEDFATAVRDGDVEAMLAEIACLPAHFWMVVLALLFVWYQLRQQGSGR